METLELRGQTPASRDERLKRLEAVLFLAREPLNSRKLSQYANLADGTEARTLIRQLNRWYDESGRAFRVEEVAGGFRLMTRPKFASWLKRLAHTPPEVRLSAPALETLAVVAYRQPVLKAVIEAIRGVNCGEVLRQLMERDLVRIVGRSEELGRPYLYGPTRKFLQVFGLRSLEDLPRVERLHVAASSAATLPDDPAHDESRLVEENDSQDVHLLVQPQKENVAVTVRIPARPPHDAPKAWDSAEAPLTLAGAFAVDDDEDFEEEFEDDEEMEDDDYEDEELAEDEEEEFDEEELEDEEWEYEDEGEEEEDFEDEEWEEVEDDDLEDEEDEEEDWEDDDEEEEWEDD